MGFKHYKFQPNEYVLVMKNGKVIRQGESSVQLTGNVNDIQSEASDNNGIAEDLATEVGRFKLE